MKQSKLIFWDFDGVIKDSVAVKTAAYMQLFEPYGEEIVERVRRHHEAHGGMSRYEKIPLYLEWSSAPDRFMQTADFCERFARLVRQAVIDSPWVPGVREYLQANFQRQRFVLVTATPQPEIEDILAALDLGKCFAAVYGAPMRKADAVRETLTRSGSLAADALLIGDSEADCDAAAANQVPFMLRRTSLNRALQSRHRGPSFESLNCE